MTENENSESGIRGSDLVAGYASYHDAAVSAAQRFGTPSEAAIKGLEAASAISAKTFIGVSVAYGFAENGVTGGLKEGAVSVGAVRAAELGVKTASIFSKVAYGAEAGSELGPAGAAAGAVVGLGFALLSDRAIDKAIESLPESVAPTPPAPQTYADAFSNTTPADVAEAGGDVFGAVSANQSDAAAAAAIAHFAQEGFGPSLGYNDGLPAGISSYNLNGGFALTPDQVQAAQQQGAILDGPEQVNQPNNLEDQQGGFVGGLPSDPGYGSDPNAASAQPSSQPTLGSVGPNPADMGGATSGGYSNAYGGSYATQEAADAAQDAHQDPEDDAAAARSGMSGIGSDAVAGATTNGEAPASANSYSAVGSQYSGPDSNSDDPSGDPTAGRSSAASYGSGFGGGLGGFGDGDGDGDGGGSTSVPVILDLAGKGIKVTPLTSSNTFVKLGDDGYAHRTAWAGAGNAVLFFDPTNSGTITESDQVVFTQWDPTASSDMQALRDVFDTNHNGKLDAGDAGFAKFKLMVTAADGTSSVETLAQAGIASINLVPGQASVVQPDGSAVTGQTTYTRTDGGTGAAADVTLASDPTGVVARQVVTHNADGSTTIETRAYTPAGVHARGRASAEWTRYG